jgi:hypothetical protein
MNAFVMPGSGHILLGMKFRGWAICLAVIGLLFAAMYKFISDSFDAMLGTHALGQMTTTFGAFAAAWQKDRDFIMICIAGIVLLWIFGVADVFINRKRIDRTSKEN